MSAPLKRISKVLKLFLLGSGFLADLIVIWLIAGWPLYFDRLAIRSEAPGEAAHIVCVAAGLTTGNLPTDDGWPRIYTAVQLYLDGFGEKIIFTGGGSGKVSEAEVYAEAAHWLGMPESAAVLDPGPNRTSEHPRNILKIPALGVTRTTTLNIVTSPLHSKRTALCFRKAGFTSFYMVTAYSAGRRKSVSGKSEPSRPVVRPDIPLEEIPKLIRADKATKLDTYRPSEKIYNDIFMRLKRRSAYFFTALRELGALVVYKLKGYI